MLDRLIDLFLQFIDLFKFWEVVDEYEEAVVLRFGRWSRNLSPGVHWRIPFGIEKILMDTVTYATINMGPQSLTTKDNKSIVVAAVIGFTTNDIKKLLLEVESANNVLEDASYGCITRYVLEHTWDELTSVEALEELTKQIRKKAFRYGIKVHDVSFSDQTISRSHRLFTEGATRMGRL